MSEKEKEKEDEKEHNKEKEMPINKNNNENNIKLANDVDQNENNINIIKNENNEETKNDYGSFNTPKSSYGSSFQSPFSSKSNSKKDHSKSNSSYLKKSYHRSRSRSYDKSKSYTSRSKSYSNRSYHRRPRNIPQVFITRLSHYVTKRDLEKEFNRFGDIKNLTLKKGYAFIEYYNPKDAKYAIRELNGRKLFGQSNRVVVEEAKISREEREKDKRREKRSKSRDKEKRDDFKEREKDKDYYYKRRSGPKKTDICFNCGKEGHWANECHEIKKDR